jgi:hypothetical protein
VTTKQEKQLQLYTIDTVGRMENGYILTHSPHTEFESTDAETSDHQEQTTLGSRFK